MNLKGQPAEGLYDEFPLPEVRRLVDAGQVTRQGANVAENLKFYICHLFNLQYLNKVFLLTKMLIVEAI
jgi:hypothetical protein